MGKIVIDGREASSVAAFVCTILLKILAMISPANYVTGNFDYKSFTGLHLHIFCAPPPDFFKSILTLSKGPVIIFVEEGREKYVVNSK